MQHGGRREARPGIWATRQRPVALSPSLGRPANRVTRTVVIMVKAPRAGTVKARLAKQVGVVRASQFYRHVAAAVIGRVAGDRRWRTWLAIAPQTALGARFWDPSLPRIAQSRGDLGHKMQACLASAGCGPILVVGSDIPALEGRHLAAAFAALDGSDAVFGPAKDGGFWLVGVRRSPRTFRLFHGTIRWSTQNALADVLASLGRHRVALADVLADVDHADDLVAVEAWSGRRVLPVRTGSSDG